MYFPSTALQACYRRYREIERRLWAKKAVCSTSQTQNLYWSMALSRTACLESRMAGSSCEDQREAAKFHSRRSVSTRRGFMLGSAPWISMYMDAMLIFMTSRKRKPRFSTGMARRRSLRRSTTICRRMSFFRRSGGYGRSCGANRPVRLRASI